MRPEEVKQLLQNLKSIRPEASWQKAHRELLLSQIGAQVTEPFSVKERAKRGIDFSFAILREISPKFIFRPVGAFALAILLIIGGSVAKVSASNSLPGDVLYSVKIAGEKAQLQLSNSPEDTARLEIEFVGRRIEELDRLLQKKENGTTRELAKKTMERAQESISHAKESLGSFQKEENNALLAKVIEAKTREYEKALHETALSLPQELTSQELRDTVHQTLREVQETQVVALHTLVTIPGSNTVVTKEELNALFEERLTTINEKIVEGEATLFDLKNNFASEIAIKEESKIVLGKIDSSLQEIRDFYSLASNTLKEGQDMTKLVESLTKASQLIVALQENLFSLKENLIQDLNKAPKEIQENKPEAKDKEMVPGESEKALEQESIFSPGEIPLDLKLE